MNPLATWMEALEAATRDAESSEAAYRAEAAKTIKRLAEERAFAYRRANLMRAIAAAVAASEDEEVAVANGLAALRNRLGWSADSDARTEIFDRFAPVCVAIHACVAGEGRGFEHPGTALQAFETWYFEARGTPFWILFENHMPETPLVDF
jgi:hypothetical protein